MATNIVKKTQRTNTVKLVSIALLTSMAYMLVFIFHILPIPALLQFLSYDPKDIVLVFIGLFYGPLSGLASATIVCLIEMITVSDTGPVGLIMNFISSAAMILVPAYIYKNKKTFSRLIIGLVLGVLLTTALMLLWNYLITPLYMGYPRENVKKMLLPLFLPFNLAKGGINAVIISLLFKPIVSILAKAKLMPSVESADDSKKEKIFGFIIGAVFVVITVIYYVAVRF